MKTFTNSCQALAIVAALFTGSTVLAASMSHAEYAAKKDQISAEYKADKAACDKLDGNNKDVCVEKAKGKEKVAKAELEANYKNTAKARSDARIAQADADYEVAKEKCDDMSGNQKDVCVKQAKAAHTKAKADAKVARVDRDATRTAENKRADARQNAREDTRNAQYKVAAEKCDAMTGAAKDQCVKDAKTHYGKM